jgi:hypothetical protein
MVTLAVGAATVTYDDDVIAAYKTPQLEQTAAEAPPVPMTTCQEGYRIAAYSVSCESKCIQNIKFNVIIYGKVKFWLNAYLVMHPFS